jgi:CO/xanthine dehydrogenase Mo-binding subunit
MSRRSMLLSTGALMVAFSTVDAQKVLAQVAPAAGKPALHPTEMDSWIAIAPNGAVTVYFGKIDGGQGTDVAIAQIVAEELDVDVRRVSVVMGDSALTCNQGGASGSNGVSLGGSALRNAAAEARRILVTRAATQWNADPATLTVTDSTITGAGNRSITYAALIGGRFFHEKIGWNNQYGNPLALTSQATVKPRNTYKVVGTSVPRADVPGKVYGLKPYVTDIHVPNMLHGRMIRPDNAGASVVAVDESSIANIPGARVVRRGDFLGVVAPKEWDAVRAARQLRVTWSAPADVFPDYAALYDYIRRAPTTRRQVTTNEGEVDAAFARAARVVEAEYEWPFQSHASMAGGCGVADVRTDGVTVWTGTQKPHFAGEGVAAILGVPVERVHSIWTPGPGSYGRNDAGDALMDAAVLSREVGAPVRVQYMRHEGTGWDPKAPPSVHKGRAAIDAQGNMIAWEFNSKGPSRADTDTNESEPKDTLAGQLLGMTGERPINFGSPEGQYEYGTARESWETIATLLPKASPLRTSHLRDPVGPQIHFASESFMDEVANAVRADPVEFRLRYVKRERDVACIRAAAERAGWRPGPHGTRRTVNGDVMRGSGIAYATRGGTIVALVADVEVNRQTGRVWARRLTLAHDCGLVINPGTLVNVVEGNLIQGLSRTFHEEVLFDRRGVKSIDWETYPILDIADAPEAIDVVILNRPEVNPTGAGEGSIRIVAAAVNNAVFEATGIRFRRAPLTPARIRGGIA